VVYATWFEHDGVQYRANVSTHGWLTIYRVDGIRELGPISTSAIGIQYLEEEDCLDRDPDEIPEAELAERLVHCLTAYR
jgi:hypothetical protein